MPQFYQLILPHKFIPVKRNKIILWQKLKSGKYRLYSLKINPKTSKQRNLGTFDTLDAAKNHEGEIAYLKSLYLMIEKILPAIHNLNKILSQSIVKTN